MISTFKSIVAGCLALGCLTLASCAAGTQTAQMDRTEVKGLPGVTKYYEQATAHHRRAFRKPVRDARARAMRNLAAQADLLLAEAQNWDSDTRLVSLAESDRPAARSAVASFRASLSELKSAAEAHDLSALRHEYARAISAYRHVHETAGAVN